MKAVGFATLLLLTACAATVSSAAGSADCEAKGFTGLAACSDCDLFEEVVKDEELAADCRGCCVKDAAAVRYAKATLEICPFKKRGLPQVTDFIAKHSQQFGSRLVVRESPHSYPRLVLSNPGKGGERSSVRIDNWSVATIVEYLKDKLLAVDTTGGGGKDKGGGGGAARDGSSGGGGGGADVKVS